MTKDNILFAIIGLLLGSIIGFIFANSVNQRGYEPRAGATNPAGSNLPADHPQVPMNGVADQAEGMAPAAITEAIERARKEPNNFDAQVEAGQLYYQINRFDEAIEFWLKASQLRPDDYATLVRLGDANFDSQNYEAAEKWYAAALVKNPNDVAVRTDLGLTFFLRQTPDIDRAIKEYRTSLAREPLHEKTLQNLTAALIRKKDAKEAQATLAKLEQVNPGNEALTKLRTDLEALSGQTQSPVKKRA